MEYDDFQTPDELSMRKMNREYAQNVAAQQSCSDCTDKTRIVERLDWTTNDNLLRILAARAGNNCQSRYLRELIELNSADRADLNSLYPREAGSRADPTLGTSAPSTFNGVLREYIQEETVLIADLVNVLNLEQNAESKSVVYNILSRRLQSLRTLAGLINGGIFG